MGAEGYVETQGKLPVVGSSEDKTVVLAKPLISIVMPYWKRYDALVRTLNSYERCGYLYKHNVEVLVVDDGCCDYRLDDLDYPIRVTHMPAKNYPMNPCTPMNVGALKSRGDYICYTNPEVEHKVDVLEHLLPIAAEGYAAYAPSYCPDTMKWHCRQGGANVVQEGLPYGSHLHFFMMIRRDLDYGFDEVYRDGAGYDDTDYAMMLRAKGIESLVLDDKLHTLHHKSGGAKINWPPGAHDRNRRIFEKKWGVRI